MRVVELLCSPLWRGGSHAIVFRDVGGGDWRALVVRDGEVLWFEHWQRGRVGLWGQAFALAHLDTLAELMPVASLALDDVKPYKPDDVKPYKPAVADTAAPDERARMGGDRGDG